MLLKHARSTEMTALDDSSLKISRILHAGYIFECARTQIAFDPIFENPFSRNCHAFPDCRFDRDQIRALRLDAVFISHYHDDHCSFESLNLLNRKTPIYIYCIHDEMFSMLKQLGFNDVHSLKIDTSVKIGSIEITPRRALDEDVDSIFQIKAGGVNVLNVVDSWIDPSTMKQLVREGHWDMVLWPFQTMREIEVIAPSQAEPATGELPSEWIEQLKELNPRYVVPSSCQFLQESWSWYNRAFFPVTYRGFKEQMKAALPAASVVRMNPSVSFNLSKKTLQPSSPLPWILPMGDQESDYEYDPSLIPPSTAEIAGRFNALTAAQTEQVYEYCRNGLPEKYRGLGSPEDSYFQKKRIWRLSVYDHTGQATKFDYSLEGASLELLKENTGAVDMSTEVPISRLYGALKFGESLTSMYVRINDSKTEIVDDPLIRCLFNGIFGAYQQAQLKRLGLSPKLAGT